MFLAIDTHVHLYPCYSYERLLASACRNTQRLLKQEGNVLSVLCLTERTGQNEADIFFSNLKSDSPWRLEAQSVRSQLLKSHLGNVLLLHGRQIISKEKLEVLGLGFSKELPDGQHSVADLIERINEEGAFAVLPWSPGKWLGKRGKVVKEALEQFGPNRLAIGDIAMRPSFCRLPKIEDHCVLAGSDPLPFSGEEKRVGSYGVVVESLYDQGKLESLVLQALRSCVGWSGIAGKRDSLITASFRWLRQKW